MSKTGDGQLRRVYVLPMDLVERILLYQNEVGFGSEVEAVRRLLDDALKARDTPKALLIRFLKRLETLKIPSEVAKEILVGHPLVSEMGFNDDNIEVWLRGGKGHYKITEKGMILRDTDGSGTWEEETNKFNKKSSVEN